MMPAPTAPCNCPTHRDPEALELYEAACRLYAEDVRRNRAGFDLYCADLDAGRPTKAPAEYRAIVDAEAVPA